jgi:hypothetical protein
MKSLTQEQIIQGEMELIEPSGPKKLYLIPGKVMGMHVPMTLVSLDSRDLEKYRRLHSMVLEIGDAHPDLPEGIEWEVRGIRRVDVVNLPGSVTAKKG